MSDMNEAIEFRRHRRGQNTIRSQSERVQFSFCLYSYVGITKKKKRTATKATASLGELAIISG